MNEELKVVNFTWDELRGRHKVINETILTHLFNAEGHISRDDHCDLLTVKRTERTAIEEEMDIRVREAVHLVFHAFYWDATPNKIRTRVSEVLSSEPDHTSVDQIIERAKREYSEYNQDS